MFDKKTIRDIDVLNKRIILRADWDVPGDKEGNVTDDFRIRAGLPTLEYLLEHDCSVTVLSKRGRPDGPGDNALSMEPVAKRAAELLGKEVGFVDDLVGETAKEAVSRLKPGEVLLLQNTRFYEQEATGDEDFARQLAAYGDIFVFDAFAMAHRTDTSVVGINKFLPSVSGFLIENEINQLSKATSDPKKPVLAITGGAKLETKLPLLDNFMNIADDIVVAGVMANVLLSAQGHNVGRSIFEQTDLAIAKKVLDKAQSSNVRFVLPTADVAVGKDRDDSERREIDLKDIADDDYILDFGRRSTDEIKRLISQATTIIWNGPLGVYENPAYAWASQEIARAIADSPALSIVGGGDTAEVVNSLGLADQFTHVSTGGGASLDFMSGKPLPGIEALLDKAG